MKHTRGPWTAIPQLNTEKRQSSYADTDVAYFIETDAVTLESDVEANARLIAAAPDLLELLLILKNDLSVGGQLSSEVKTRMIERVVAKARGES